MSLESKIDQLIIALDNNTAALRGVVSPGPAPAAAPAKAPKTAPAAAEEPAEEVTLDTVKQRITLAMQSLPKADVARMIDEASPGARNASTMKPEHYAAFVTKIDMALAEKAAP